MVTIEFYDHNNGSPLELDGWECRVTEEEAAAFIRCAETGDSAELYEESWIEYDRDEEYDDELDMYIPIINDMYHDKVSVRCGGCELTVSSASGLIDYSDDDDTGYSGCSGYDTGGGTAEGPYIIRYIERHEDGDIEVYMDATCNERLKGLKL